ncbi:MAG: O-methyltransferase [Gordonia polyisoprenivorans]|nr:O-methyltransferase [Gordonia polyisoprenivorans]
MAEQLWKETDRFLESTFGPPSPDLIRAADSVRSEKLPPISINDVQGRQIALLASLIGARRALEVGTLAGYSTLCLAAAVGDGGHVVTLENNPIHAGVARTNFESAQHGHRVDLRLGNAIDLLHELRTSTTEPFDFFFIDADQHNNVRYLEACHALGRPGSVIVVDNVIRGGAVADSATTNPAVRATQAMLEIVAQNDGLDGAVFQTVGSRGHDGMLVARIL